MVVYDILYYWWGVEKVDWGSNKDQLLDLIGLVKILIYVDAVALHMP